MKNSRKTYPAIRETFVCSAALADYLGRSVTCVSRCLNKKSEFSPAEKVAISVKVGQPWEVIESA